MKANRWIVILLLLSIQNIWAQNIQKTNLGVKANIQSVQVEIQFFSPQMVRILKSPSGGPFDKKSLSVVQLPIQTEIKITSSGQNISLESSAIKVVLDTLSGKISFFTLQGQSLFTEKDFGIQFTSVTDANNDTYLVRQAFMLDRKESIYGLGQQQNGKLNQRGQKVILQQDNMKICIPFIQSNKGYGIFWDNYSSTTFVDNPQELSLESLGNCADYYFMYGGNADGVVAQMRFLTGQSPMFPLWAYGFMQSRERYKTQDELVGVVEKYRSLNVPLDGIVQDWRYWGNDSNWNAMRFDSSAYPDPKRMVDKIHQLNAHLMIVAWPGFGPLTQQYAELREKKMLIDFDTWPPKSGTKPYDPYNPEARDIYWKFLNKGVFSFNTDAWWLDSSEPDHINVKEKDFDQPTYLGSYRTVINAFPLMHIKGVYEHQRATTSDKRVCILTRSAFAGQQRFAANSWSGDVTSSWETLRKQIPAGLNFSLSGIPYWNTDIGGFFSGRNFPDGVKDKTFHELYIRWMQFAAFTPMMRSHGTDTPREIYQFGNRGDWSFDAQEKCIHLRYHLLPYLYATAWGVTNRSGSFMRALFMDFAADTSIYNINNEYLFGNNILVAPVTDPLYMSKQDGKVVEDFSHIKTHKVYLPQGVVWYDFWTAEKFQGGQDINKETPIDIIPLYVKAGSVLPWGPKVQYAAERKWDNLEIRIYPGADGEFVLYEDENNNYNYEKGIYSTILFRWNDKTKELTIGARKGSFPEMLQKRIFHLIIVNQNKGNGIDLSTNPDKRVSYNGQIVTIKLR